MTIESSTRFHPHSWFGVMSLLCGFAVCHADVGPENTVLVVNPASADSVRIAKFYARERGIHPNNVVELVGVPDLRRVGVKTFQFSILRPIIKQIEQRGLGRQVRLIAYSAGFPTEINIAEHCEELQGATNRKIFTPVASLNGATFHFTHVLRDKITYLQPGSNFYARGPMERSFGNPFARDPGDFDDAKLAHQTGDFKRSADLYRSLLKRNPDQHPPGNLGRSQRHRRRSNRPGDTGPVDRRPRRLVVTPLRRSGSRPSPRCCVAPASARSSPRCPTGSPIGNPPLDSSAIASGPPTASPPASAEGYNYLLSACLAVTGPGAMTADEAITQLQRSIDADGHRPDGKFLFAQTGDVRTTTRLPGFGTAVKALALAGHRAEIVPAAVPQNQPNLAGVMLGTAKFDWSSSGSTLAPGAIAENLTSFGGAFDQTGQTTLLEMLRAGAALSSGTVTEPYALQFKFPHPMMHASYASGLTAIEAMYSQVQSPYQLLIVGDPLCSPFKANRSIQAVGRPAGDGSIEITVGLESPGKPLVHFEIHIDGTLRVVEPFAQSTDQINLTCKIEHAGGGEHDIRVVLVAGDLAQSRYGVNASVQLPLQ